MSDLSEEIYQAEPVIAGVRVRPYNQRVKLKLARLLRWLEGSDPATVNEEILFCFAYLIAAPEERVALHTLTREAYLTDKDAWIGTVTDADLRAFGEWFLTVTDLERRTQVEILPKPGRSGETPPKKSLSRPPSPR